MNDEPSGTGPSSGTARVQSPSGVSFADNDLPTADNEGVGVVEPTAADPGAHDDPVNPANPGDHSVVSSAGPHVQEISQQNIKNRLNEVITEIEREVERELDREDREELSREERTRSGAQVRGTGVRGGKRCGRCVAVFRVDELQVSYAREICNMNAGWGVMRVSKSN